MESGRSYTMSTRPISGYRHIGDVLADLRDVVSSRPNANDVLGPQRFLSTPTGFQDLDYLLGGGLQPGTFSVLAAVDGSGKTSLALNLAYNSAVRYGRRVLVCSLEATSRIVTERLLTIETGIDGYRLQRRALTDSEWALLSRGIHRLGSARLVISDSARLPLSKLREQVINVSGDRPLDLVIIDNLQLMPDDTDINYAAAMDITSHGLKTAARQLNVPIFVTSQVSSAAEERSALVPQLSDLRGSSSIEEDADQVFFLYRDELHNPFTAKPGIAEVYLAKHRHGPTGMTRLRFLKHCGRFEELMIYKDVA